MDTINQPIFYPFQELTFKEAGGGWYILGILLLILAVIVFMVSSLHFSYLSDKVKAENNSKNPPKQIINQSRADGFSTSNFLGFMVCILFLFYVVYKACFLTHNTNLARKQTYDNEIKEFEKNFEKYETQRKTLEKQRIAAEERNMIYNKVEKIRKQGLDANLKIEMNTLYDKIMAESAKLNSSDLAIRMEGEKNLPILENQLNYYKEAIKDYVRNNYEKDDILTAFSKASSTQSTEGLENKEINKDSEFGRFAEELTKLQSTLKEEKQRNINDKYYESIADPSTALAAIQKDITTLESKLFVDGKANAKISIDDYNQEFKRLQELKLKLSGLQQKQQKQQKEEKINEANALKTEQTKLNRKLNEALQIYTAYNTTITADKSAPDKTKPEYQELEALQAQVNNAVDTKSLDSIKVDIDRIITTINSGAKATATAKATEATAKAKATEATATANIAAEEAKITIEKEKIAKAEAERARAAEIAAANAAVAVATAEAEAATAAARAREAEIAAANARARARAAEIAAANPPPAVATPALVVAPTASPSGGG